MTVGVRHVLPVIDAKRYRYADIRRQDTKKDRQNTAVKRE